MDNNEAREMDYATEATGPDHAWYEAEYQRELATQLAYDRRHPENRWNRENATQADRWFAQFTACPTCAGVKERDQVVCTECHNPNRPTPADYCAACGEVPYDLADHKAGTVKGEHVSQAPIRLSFYVSDLITLLEKETHIDRNQLYAWIAREAESMGLGPTA